MSTLDITIAGAGIGGLAVATALARSGHRVRVAERAPAISEIGAGIQISPNGRAVLTALGLGEAFDAVALNADAVQLLHGPAGTPVTRLDLSRDPKVWSFVHRARLIDILHKAAVEAGAIIETGREIEAPGSGAALDGDDLLIGADGLHSGVRMILNPENKPFFTHQVAWRAVISDGDSPAVAEVHMGPRRHLVSYPLSGGLRNIVAVEERTAWADEGWSIEDDPANLCAAFQGYTPRVQGWLNQVDKVYLWGLFRHTVARTWWQGRQVLLGDAAHPTLLFLAQGANLALEDAWILAACLQAHELPRALDRYQSLRTDRARDVVDAATRNAQNYHIAFPPLRFAAHTALRILGRVSPDAMLGRFDWLYGYDPTKIDV